MEVNKDVLVKLDTPEVVELKDFYESYKNEFPHIYSFLKTTLKWRETHPDYITIFSVEGDFRKDGTFIALLTFSCYDIILHTLEHTLDKLRKGLTQTNLINWNDNEILFYATHEKLKPMIYQALEAIKVPIKLTSVTKLWQISEQQALQFPNSYEHLDYYMDRIKPDDAEIINSVWPPRYTTSLEYLRTFIIMNCGYGIYEKTTNKLVSWILVNVMGQLGVLQTREGYFKNGFGLALTKRASRAVALNGDNPIGTVHDGNIPSEKLFSSAKFIKKYSCIYIRCEKRQV